MAECCLGNICPFKSKCTTCSTSSCSSCCQASTEEQVVTIHVKSAPTKAPKERRGLFRRPAVNFVPQTQATATNYIAQAPVTYSMVNFVPTTQPMMMAAPAVAASQLYTTRNVQLTTNNAATPTRNKVAERQITSSGETDISKRVDELAKEVKKIGEDLDKMISIVGRHEKVLEELLNRAQ